MGERLSEGKFHVFVKELKLFNHDVLIGGKLKSTALFLQIWLGAISIVICYPVISAFMFFFFAMELTPKWKKNFQYKKNKYLFSY